MKRSLRSHLYRECEIVQFLESCFCLRAALVGKQVLKGDLTEECPKRNVKSINLSRFVADYE